MIFAALARGRRPAPSEGREPERGVVRLPRYDADKVARDESERQALSTECDRLHAAIVRWCKAHFAESFVAWICVEPSTSSPRRRRDPALVTAQAWMHLKVVRAFVESVLRYGLPVDFVTALLVPSKYREQPLQSALDKMFAHLDGEGALVPEDSDEEKYSNYVLQKCTAQMT